MREGVKRQFCTSGTPSLKQHRLKRQNRQMKLLTSDEFARMEQLLADLLPNCDDRETADLLRLHERLQSIYSAQSSLHASHDRLMALRSQTER